MFDGIIYNMLTDMVRNAMIALAAYLGLTGDTQTQFIAGGVAILAGLWQWYENGGHQKIVTALKTKTNSPTLKVALNKTAGILALFFVLGMLSGVHDANAQTVTKAPPPVTAGWQSLQPCTPVMCSGIYIGGTIGGVGSNADIVGEGINNSIFAGGGIFAGDIGVQYWNDVVFLGAEVGVGGQISTTANVGSLGGNENGFLAYQIAKVGGSLSGLFGVQPAPPSDFPTNITANVIAPYALAGAVERQFANGWASGGGIEFDVSPHSFVDLKYMYVNYGQATNGNLQLTSENLILASWNYKF